MVGRKDPQCLGFPTTVSRILRTGQCNIWYCEPHPQSSKNYRRASKVPNSRYTSVDQSPRPELLCCIEFLELYQVDVGMCLVPGKISSKYSDNFPGCSDDFSESEPHGQLVPPIFGHQFIYLLQHRTFPRRRYGRYAIIPIALNSTIVIPMLVSDPDSSAACIAIWPEVLVLAVHGDGRAGSTLRFTRVYLVRPAGGIISESSLGASSGLLPLSLIS